MGHKSRSKQSRHEHALAETAVAADTPAVTPDTRRLVIISLALALLTLAVFAQLRTHQFLNFDDPIYVTTNEHVLKGITLDGLGWAFTSLDFNWHPVTWITHMLDVQLFGVNAGAHLLVNLAFHVANAILLFLLLVRMTGTVWRSAIVAALFAIHPLHVESVAWLSERKDVLSTLFLILTVWYYVSFTRTRSAAHYALMVAAFILGLMSKGMLVTLPFVLLLLDFWPLRRLDLEDFPSIRRALVEKLPLFLLLIPAIAITYIAQKAASAVVEASRVPAPIRIANAFITYVTYLRKTIWPNDLAIPYEYGLVVSRTETAVCVVVFMAITAAVIVYRERRYLPVGWFIYAGMLVPVIGLVQIGAQSMADRYTYVPLIGIFIAAVWLVADFVRTRPSLRLPAIAGTALLILVFAAQAWRQTRYWKDSLSLFTHTVTVMPQNTRAHSNLAAALIESGRYDDAAQHYRAATQIRSDLDTPWVGLGTALAGLGRLDEARASLLRALELNPKNSAARVELARVELASGKGGAAAAELAKAGAGANDPQTLGMLALARGDAEEARKQYQVAVDRNPRSADARNNLASALARLGRDAEALAQYEEAIRLAPSQYDARMNAGALLSRLGRNIEAAEHFTAAAALRPSSTEPLVFHALILASMRDFPGAIAKVDRVLQLDEKNGNAQFTNAIRIPFKESNLRDYRAYLEQQR